MLHYYFGPGLSALTLSAPYLVQNMPCTQCTLAENLLDWIFTFASIVLEIKFTSNKELVSTLAFYFQCIFGHLYSKPWTRKGNIKLAYVFYIWNTSLIRKMSQPFLKRNFKGYNFHSILYAIFHETLTAEMLKWFFPRLHSHQFLGSALLPLSGEGWSQSTVLCMYFLSESRAKVLPKP